jgi:aspartate--ammonia ligase
MTTKKTRKPYSAKLSLLETEKAIKDLKDFFERTLSDTLALQRVSAPLFVLADSGLNDNLNGIERPVGFEFEEGYAEIVHSLAKWKRMALHRYGFEMGQGLYTDMNAIRRDEVLGPLHSIYVDQWDWEAIIDKQERTLERLKQVVKKIYSVFLATESHIIDRYPALTANLPAEISFITAQELEDQYPGLTPKEREDKVAFSEKAVCIMQIGGRLLSGIPHDGRAPDYDDWTLNADIVFWNPVLECAFELSSMGIRVDPTALNYQLGVRGCPERIELPYHQSLVQGKLPQTIGGGIGQSRLCMFFLEKAHIGEVQASLWDQKTLADCEARGIELL